MILNILPNPSQGPAQVSGGSSWAHPTSQWGILSFRKGVPQPGMGGGAGRDEISMSQLPAGLENSVLTSHSPASSCAALVGAPNLFELQFAYL